MEGDEDMMRSLAACKYKCPKYDSHGGCNKGRKCRFSHANEEPSAAPFSLPYMDTRVAEDGDRKMIIRLPLTQALMQFYKENRAIVLGRQAGREQVGRQRAHLRLELAFSVAWDMVLMPVHEIRIGFLIQSMDKTTFPWVRNGRPHGHPFSNTLFRLYLCQDDSDTDCWRNLDDRYR